MRSVQQSFTHGAFGHPYPIDAEVIDHFQEDGQARGKHRRSFGIDVRQIEFVDVTRGDHALGERTQVVERDARRIGIEPAQHIADDPHGAGTAEGLQPAELAVCLLNGFEFEPHAVRARSKRFSEILPSSKQTALRPTHPTEKLSSSRGLNPSPITHFRRAAADIDHEPLVRTHRAGMHDARIDEARLLQAGNDLDGMTQRGPRAFQEPALAFGLAQGVRAHHRHAVRVHGAQPLPEALQAPQRALGGGVIQPPRCRRDLRRGAPFRGDDRE